MLELWTNVGLTATYFSCFSDNSDDSDGALGSGLSLDPSTQHTALTVKSEPCEEGDGFTEGKPINGVLLQGKGKINTETLIFVLFTYYYTCTPSLESLNGSWKIPFMSCDSFFLLPANSTDQKADKTGFYNFSKLKKNRKWLKVFYRHIIHCTTALSIQLINR